MTASFAVLLLVVAVVTATDPETGVALIGVLVPGAASANATLNVSVNLSG